MFLSCIKISNLSSHFSLDCSIYNAMGHAFMSFVNALMTFDPQYTMETNKLLNRASESLEKFRRKAGFAETLSNLFTKELNQQCKALEILERKEGGSLELVWWVDSKSGLLALTGPKMSL